MPIALLAATLPLLTPQASPPIIIETAAVSRLAQFGEAIALDDPYLVVCAPFDWPASSGRGSARIYRNHAGAWDLEHTVEGSMPDGIWCRADIDGTRVALPRLRGSSVHPPSEVKILDRIGGQWMETASITCSDPTVEDFGLDVALDGDRLAVLATFYGTVASHSTDSTNQVYIYDKVGGTWVESARLRPSPDPVSGDDPYSSHGGYRADIDLEGDRVVLGTSARTVGGMWNVGLVAVFELDQSGAWIETAQLIPPIPEPSPGFGISLSLVGDSLVVGSPGSSALGHPRAGTVETFEFASGSWSHVDTLTQPAPSERAAFGFVVASDGARIAASIEPISFEENGQRSDRVETFARLPTGQHTHSGTLEEPHRHYRRTFGASLALDSETLIVGAPGTLAFGENRGVVYAYSSFESAGPISQVTCPGVRCPCPSVGLLDWAGCGNSERRHGRLTAGGSASIADDTLELITAQVPPNSLVYLLVAPTSGRPVAFGGGNLCIDGSHVLSVQVTPFSGAVHEPRGLASRIGALPGMAGPVLPGETWTFQAAYRDPRRRLSCRGDFGAQPSVNNPRLNATNAVSVTFRP